MADTAVDQILSTITPEETPAGNAEATETVSEETPTEETTEETVSEETPTEETPVDSSRFAALAKKEAALVREREAFRDTQAKADRFNSLADLAKTDPLKALSEMGLSHEQIEKAILGDGEEKARIETENKLPVR